MIIKKIMKFFALIYFWCVKIFLKKSRFINFIYFSSSFQGLKKISMGKLNTFQKYSNVIVEDYSNDQHIYFGNSNTIASFAFLRSHGGYIEIGNNNFIGERVQIQGNGGIEIGNHCMIATNTFISSSNHDFHNPSRSDYLLKEIPAKTVIEDYVWIGANVVIVAGVMVGHHSIIGAGTIVTKDIEPYSMVVGNPARVIKTFNKSKQVWEKIEKINSESFKCI